MTPDEASVDRIPEHAMATVIYDEKVVAVAGAEPEGEDLWLTEADLARTTGCELGPEGACVGDLCVPLPPGEELARRRGDETWVNLTRLARWIEQPVVVSSKHRVWLFGDRPVQLAGRLGSLTAPDFTLPDLAGRLHSLSQYRGKKVFLVTWASW